MNRFVLEENLGQSGVLLSHRTGLGMGMSMGMDSGEHAQQVVSKLYRPAAATACTIPPVLRNHVLTSNNTACCVTLWTIVIATTAQAQGHQFLEHQCQRRRREVANGGASDTVAFTKNERHS